MKADDRIIFRLPSSLKSEFTRKIDRLGKKQAEALIEMVQKFVEESDEPSEIQLIKQQLNALQEEMSKIKEQQKEYVGK
jgi:gas vesicle protein